MQTNQRGEEILWHPRGSELSKKDIDIANKYLEECQKETAGKVRIPWIEELAMKLDVDDNTVVNWTKGEDDLSKLFCATYKKIKSLQKLRLSQRTIGRFNAAGPIFLLKANHGMKDRIDLTTDDEKLEGPTVVIRTKE